MKNTKHNDEAVSPVIGVILMVAITVILAAVIAAFVFGMSGQITKTKIVAATVQQPTQGTIVVTYQGGQDAGSFNYAEVTVTPEDGTAIGPGTVGDADSNLFTNAVSVLGNGDPTTADDGILGARVGHSVAVKAQTDEPFSGKDHVVVVGYFTDSTQQVIIDTYV